jgi:hypothetical protein
MPAERLVANSEKAGGGFVKPCGVGLLRLRMGIVKDGGGVFELIDGVVDGRVFREVFGHREKDVFHGHERGVAGSGP